MKISIITLLLFCMPQMTFDVITYQENQVFQTENLSQFHNALRLLETKQKKHVNIVHIGDSHIQADFLTGSTRNSLQKRFGNAGRGFIFPYRIAKSWGPLDVKFKHTGVWNYYDILHDFNSCEIGASGFTVSGKDDVEFSLFVKNHTRKNSFNKLIIFDKNGSYVPTFASSFYTVSTVNNRTHIDFENQNDSVVLSPSSYSNLKSELQGIIMQNGDTGILYHAMGVNGSGIKQYLRSDFENNLAEIDPELVIISFGTNDCYVSSKGYCNTCNKERYSQLIDRIRMVNPAADILITTPPDHFFSRKYSNPNVVNYSNMMYELASEKNVALWDLYGLMGKQNSILKWRKEALARKDLIHFTRAGYELQGQLLYEALLKDY